MKMKSTMIHKDEGKKNKDEKPTVSPSHCLYTSRSQWKQCPAPLWIHPDQQRPRRNPYHDAPYSKVTGSLDKETRYSKHLVEKDLEKVQCHVDLLQSTVLPGLSCMCLGRNFWKVLKIPALEITTGAWTSISSCPLSTVTPNTHIHSFNSTDICGIAWQEATF